MEQIREERMQIPMEWGDDEGILRPSALFSFWSGMAMAHWEDTPIGQTALRQQGLLWIISRQCAVISRLPSAGEQVVVRTWADKPRHGMFPRYYELAEPAGRLLVQGGALWTLLEEKRRTMVHCREEVFFPAVKTGREVCLLTPINEIPGEHHFPYTVRPEDVDGNGHMNNAHYFDMVASRVKEKGKDLREIQVKYAREAKCGDTITVDWGFEKGGYFFQGNKGRCFSLSLRYGEEGAGTVPPFCKRK